jgi:hypothetical protein
MDGLDLFFGAGLLAMLALGMGMGAIVYRLGEQAGRNKVARNLGYDMVANSWYLTDKRCIEAFKGLGGDLQRYGADLDWRDACLGISMMAHVVAARERKQAQATGASDVATRGVRPEAVG